MKEYQTRQIRNIALISHNGAGKTTFVERLLFDTGVTTRMGRVENGTAAMDFEDEEVARNSSIATAIAPLNGKTLSSTCWIRPATPTLSAKLTPPCTWPRARSSLLKPWPG
jgi:translation elongation factor EF-G